MIWGIWRERNLQVFENKSRSMEVRHDIIREMGYWLLITPEFRGLPISMFLRDWASSLAWNPPLRRKEVLSWISPPEGLFKLHFDGASKGNPGPARFGCVIRNHTSDIIKVYCEPLGICDSIKAKAMVLLMGLKVLKGMDVQKCIV